MGERSRERLGLGRACRIKQGRDFTRLKLEGERLSHGCLTANWFRLSPDLPSRLGVITSARIGNAVVRSRARRLLREAFRLHQHDLRDPIDLILIARQSLASKKFSEVERDFLQTLRKARLLK